MQLRDGTPLIVRAVEPGDRDALLAGFEKLSDESRYKRFLSTVTRLSDSQVTYLTDVDHHDHEALVALLPDGSEVVGVARYVREAPRSEVAEAAVTVADELQGRGLGTMLLQRLAQRAREERVHRFSALVLAQNRDMLDLLEALGDVVSSTQSSNTIALEIELPPEGVGDRMARALREAASGAMRFVGRRVSGDHSPAA